jgi:RNA polymerase-interacting CarD/CdnL/TRCF family regulator
MPATDRSARSSLRFAVDDLVVYASHGIGRVESTGGNEGTPRGTIVVQLESGLKVTLPLARAREALRCLSGEPELEEVRRTLRAEVAAPAEHWSRRRRYAQEKLTAGEIGGLAEIVRDGLRRERRLTTTSSKPLANELFRRARKLLTAEVAACRGIEPEDADAWVVQQALAGQAS